MMTYLLLYFISFLFYRKYHKNDLHAITSRLRLRHVIIYRRFWNIRSFSPHFYLTFSHFSTRQSGHDPVGPKIWISNSSIRPLEQSWAENNEKLRFFDFRHLMNHREKWVLRIGKFCHHAIAWGLSFRLKSCPWKLLYYPLVARKSTF